MSAAGRRSICCGWVSRRVNNIPGITLDAGTREANRISKTASTKGSFLSLVGSARLVAMFSSGPENRVRDGDMACAARVQLDMPSVTYRNRRGLHKSTGVHG